MTILHKLNNLGQAVWLDYIRRTFIESGDLQDLITQGVRGVTSNPSIFEKAIAGSDDYEADLRQLVNQGKTIDEIYEALVLHDIQHTANLLTPVYQETNGDDGYVSLEVNPNLAHDTLGTIEEAKRLFGLVARPNLMIKIPATPAGIPAIEAAIASGINVNVTLIFSVKQYEAVVEAYITGLERLADKGGDLSQVASVASFFVSRVDGMVDKALEAKGNTDLQGKIAVDNSKLAYTRFKDLFSGSRWEALSQEGARVQRPLWASTSTKNPAYSDTLYVDTLIGPHTVNTLPTNTLEAVLDHGQAKVTINDDVAASQARFKQLADLGIDIDAITEQLQQDGVAAFAKSFEALMGSIAQKQSDFLHNWQPLTAKLGTYQAVVEATLKEMNDKEIIRRIWAIDHTVWQPEPTEISNRLAWLTIPDILQKEVNRMKTLTRTLKSEGYTDVLLLGMGGSSLAPEVFSHTIGQTEQAKKKGLKLHVLDSTDPGTVLAYRQKLNPATTLFIVATKSGGTVETFSFFKYFYNWLNEVLDEVETGRHFIAITDPGSKLVTTAEKYQFRDTFLNNPNIGGRYSALSYFGLLPATLVGVNVKILLGRALMAARNAGEDTSVVDGLNFSAYLGAIMGKLAQAGRDKVTVITSPIIASFGDWVEQLIAESTGKEGKGILPVVGEALNNPTVYGADRLFVYLRLEGDDTHDTAVKALEDAGHPLVVITLNDLFDLGGQFFLWEMATAIAGYVLDINPFDQPNVESAKVLARKMVTAYHETGELPTLTPTFETSEARVYGDLNATTPTEALQQFVSQAQAGDYIALQAYVQPTPEVEEALQALRISLRDQTKLATTVGYGPRFLHSTGQLHKGDGGNGVFIQITATDPEDAAIPNDAGESASDMTFSVLKASQALGDRQALVDNGRRVIRFHFNEDVVAGLQGLVG